MINREHIERILKLNGLAPTAKDEEIKSILLSARYKEHEVDAALMVLREDTRTQKTRVDGLHKIFRTDDLLSPQEISALLGVDVRIDKVETSAKKLQQVTAVSQAGLLIIATMLALLVITSYMYFAKMGIFHHTSAFAPATMTQNE
jgi:hypothetical protein